MSDSKTEFNSSNPARKGGGLWVILLVLLGAAIFIFVANRQSDSSATESVAVGKPAPQMDLVQLDTGQALDAPSVDPSGKVTLLHFWGTWCGPCRMEFPELSATARDLSSDPNFRFLPVSCESGPGETLGSLAEKTNEYFASERIASPALADPRGVTRTSAAERLEQPSLYFPTSMLIGPDGKIVGVWEGYTPDSVDEIADAVRRLL